MVAVDFCRWEGRNSAIILFVGIRFQCNQASSTPVHTPRRPWPFRGDRADIAKTLVSLHFCCHHAERAPSRPWFASEHGANCCDRLGMSGTTCLKYSRRVLKTF